MPVPVTLLVVGFLLVVFLLIRRQWMSSAAKKEEVMGLVKMAAEESYLAEVRAVAEYGSGPKVHRCAVCLYPTTTRCARCKATRYCSSKCQILHWRRGHKDECRQPTLSASEDENEKHFGSDDSSGTDRGSPSHVAMPELSGEISPNGLHATGINCRLNNGVSVDIARDISGSRLSVQEIQARPEAVDSSSSSNDKDKTVETRMLNRKKSHNCPEEVKSTTKNSKGRATEFGNAQSQIFSSRKSTKFGALSDTSNLGHSLSIDNEEGDLNGVEDRRASSLSSSTSAGMPSSMLDACASTSSKSVLPSKFSSKLSISQAARGGLKTSVQRVVQHFRVSRSSKLPQTSSAIDEVAGKYNFKMSCPYEMFVKLYFCDGVELHPFGLVNCGNSCYANAVLQCLAFTRPLLSYLVRGLHSKACRKKSWCFVCEFEYLILKAREGESPLSPIKILSKIQKIGKHLGPGREEDAHEFLRYAVDTMQSVFLKEVDASGPFAEETTLLGLTFGGYLHSKIKCMKCLHKSERSERMMDLTVEIEGEIGSLEEALGQFTAYEVLDGENRYHCGRCKSYQKAKKKLMILETPNILTIVLKRFQSNNFGKLSKPVHFPEVLNMAPYMSNPSDSSPVYSLYAVVVHLDVMSVAVSGHYVCYIKTLRGDWFRIDDSTVTPVRLETVLLEGAYMLLYARHSPRPSASLSKKAKARRNLEAIPSSRNNDPSIAKQTHSNSSMSEPRDKRFQSIEKIPRVDSWSGSSSSLFSSSDASSCSTKDSRVEELSDYLFGGVEPGWYTRFVHNNDSSSSGSSSSSTSDVRYRMSLRKTNGHGSTQPFY